MAQCKKCGKTLPEGEKRCKLCGQERNEKIGNIVKVAGSVVVAAIPIIIKVVTGKNIPTKKD